MIKHFGTSKVLFAKNTFTSSEKSTEGILKKRYCEKFREILEKYP